MIRVGRWKLVYQPIKGGVLYQLFDLETDPACQQEYIAYELEPAEILKQQLLTWRSLTTRKLATSACIPWQGLAARWYMKQYSANRNVTDEARIRSCSFMTSLTNPSIQRSRTKTAIRIGWAANFRAVFSSRCGLCRDRCDGTLRGWRRNRHGGLDSRVSICLDA